MVILFVTSIPNPSDYRLIAGNPFAVNVWRDLATGDKHTETALMLPLSRHSRAVSRVALLVAE